MNCKGILFKHERTRTCHLYVYSQNHAQENYHSCDIIFSVIGFRRQGDEQKCIQQMAALFEVSL